jgi:hypothetical protein
MSSNSAYDALEARMAAVIDKYSVDMDDINEDILVVASAIKDAAATCRKMSIDLTSSL